MRIVYDIECNGLEPDRLWCIVAFNLDSNTLYTFADEAQYHGSLRDGINLLQNAKLLIGHNILGFDSRIVDRLYKTSLLDKKSHDTFVMSQVLSFKRKHKHGLAGWGEHLGNHKGDFHEFDHFSTEMVKYCQQDVRVNVEIYKRLLQEYAKIYERNPLIKEGLRVEHATAVFNAKCRETGWNFDLNKARETQGRMLERMKEIEDELEPQMGSRTVYIDKEPKTPKFKKNGEYTATTTRQLSEFFGYSIDPSDTRLMGPGDTFQRSREEPIRLGSLELVKEWLIEQGWKPDEWQKKKEGFHWITLGPKLTSTSLQKMGPIGEMVDEWTTLRNRESVIRGWMNAIDMDSRLHGNMWTCGTPTFRCRHEVIVNLPAVGAPWGKELRELLIADPGMVIVGADSSGNQLRGLCHYVSNDDFTNEVINGDQHQRNADTLGCSRPVAKSYLYAYLFGAGDGKLGQVLTGVNNASVGKDSKERFAKSIKGLQELRDKLNKIWNQTNFNGEPWLPGLDGRMVFTASNHQCLNYLLQSAEAITCKAALMYQMEKIKEEGIDAQPRLFYHDESAWQCRPEDADKVGQILKESFKIGPQLFNVNCMDGGDPCMGSSYADVH